MRLISFSVQNYRSITKANKIEVGNSTVLVGPNNEGKSNILRALVTAMQVLKNATRHLDLGVIQRVIFVGVRALRYYKWTKDYPIHLQKKNPEGASVFVLEFQLTKTEIAQFKKETKSDTNGVLPIELSLSATGAKVKILKKGPGGSKMSAKAGSIATFVARRIEFEYVPAIRDAESAQEVVDSLLQKQLATVESAPEYKAALAKIEELQRPVLLALAANVYATMKTFLPAVKKVSIDISGEQRQTALRKSAHIVSDDGTATELEYKRDGVQSLAALALMRHASETAGIGKSFVIAIEEPESHLHPSAMHALRKVLAELAQKYQVVTTTHSPLFIDRLNVSSNILVSDNKAVPAKSIDQVRDLLGVRPSDNLRHAEYVVITEGEDDKTALKAILTSESPILGTAIQSGRLAFEPLHGGSNLSYVVTLVRDALLCECHSFLDNDDAGRNSYQTARTAGLVDTADVTFASVLGMKDSELEDLYDLGFYKDLIWNQYKVQLEHNAKFNTNQKKWSDRVAEIFKMSGRSWDEKIEAEVKAKIADLVESNPKAALNVHKRGVIDTLVQTLIAALKV